jgi:cellulose synthase/poly-beta-1,6-N-acetylglucosamine synthase-like glycosyltransferase
MISILVPVYREAPLLDGILSKLMKDKFRDKEIIVSIDEPTDASKELIRKYSKKVRFDVNEERMGKAKSLNEAVKDANGDILLFLDSDVKIITKNFLSRIEEEIRGVDILDVKKTIIKSSRISRFSNYEFISSNILTTFFSKMKRCLGFNGAAFAIKREVFDDIGGFKENVISEDFELGMQCYLKNKTYKYSKDIEVSTKSKDNWKEWLIQRKRWSIGGGQFFKLHWKDLVKFTVKHPNALLMLLFFTWPLLVVSLLLNTFFEDFFLFTLLTLSLKFSFIFPIFLFTGFGLLFMKNLVIFLITYIGSALLFYIAARELKFSYNIKDFTYFYFFYSPLWAAVFFFNFFKSIVLKDFRVSDWKIRA